ncbi:unnamed protein product [Hydatigera taeniaeformis]|uniref:DNA helicase n=1 Tax=Hydatigena taeniaeformis TaxID=6205 RepID=A0A0R3WJI6_HYDTA|nr:unnamed protein product [Hydatigera taeniaeformis]
MENFQAADKSRVTLLFTEFLNKDCGDAIEGRLGSIGATKESDVFSLVVNFSSLCEFSSVLSQCLLSSPLDTLSAFDEALSCFIANHSGIGRSPVRCAVRIVSLPPMSEVFRHVMPKSDDVGRFLALQCTVTRVGAIQVVQLERSYSCSKCGHTFKVEADFNQFYALSPPSRCPNSADKCVSTTFNVVDEEGLSPLHSFQEIRVNERLGYLAVGRMPRSMVCCLDAELVDAVRPGDDVIINGILTHRWRSPKVGSSFDIETVFRANSIENLSEMRFRGELGSANCTQEMGRRFGNYWSLVKPKNSFKAALGLRDEIVRSICPDVYGLYFVKLSLALALVGAPPCQDNFATGTTAAGLTAAAVRDTSGWALEAGALVLADGGVCAIDEFTSLRGADRAAVHEAMEQQTVSLAKAGLVARLNCRCAVIAASSLPTGTEHSSNLLPTPLLSRFDLVWRLLDPIGCEAWDSAVADHVLGFKSTDQNGDDGEKEKPARRITWTTEELRNYISWVRGEFQPRLSSDAAILLQRYYELRRRTLRRMHGAEDDHVVAGRTTLRLLESLVRLTQAHARLMARHVAVVEDAVMVIWLMDCSFQSTFGRSASAIKVNGRCLSPEETVKCHNMECTFEEILEFVFAQLNLGPEDIGNGWFGRISSSTKSEFQPIHTSTQMKSQSIAEHRFFCPRALSGDAVFPIGSARNCDELGVEHASFKTISDSLDLYANSSEPREVTYINELPAVITPKLTGEKCQFFKPGSGVCLTNVSPVEDRGIKDKSTPEILLTPTVKERQNCAVKVMPQVSVLRTQSQLSSESSIDNSGQTKCPITILKKGNNENVINLRIKGKLSHFTFSEGTALSPSKAEVLQMGLGSDAENNMPSKRVKFRSRKDFLNFQDLAPEDWTFANIDTDFDL